MNGNNSYKDRQTVQNTGELIFEEYCQSRGVEYKRLGFDEKNNFVPYFWKINPLVRNLPDYFVATKDRAFLVMVKGTCNMKKSEISLIPQFMEWYSSRECPLYYAFCFKGESKPFFITPDRVIELYQQAEVDKRWNDGIVYRSLKIEKSSERTL